MKTHEVRSFRNAKTIGIILDKLRQNKSKGTKDMNNRECGLRNHKYTILCAIIKNIRFSKFMEHLQNNLFKL